MRQLRCISSAWYCTAFTTVNSHTALLCSLPVANNDGVQVSHPFFPTNPQIHWLQIAGGRRPAIGPAAPPPELLAAAAQIPWEEDEEDVEDLIGPAPPEMAEELEGVGGDERVAEVARVIRCAVAPELHDVWDTVETAEHPACLIWADIS